MATCQTSRWTSTAPYVLLTVTPSSTTTVTTLSWKLEYISDYPPNTAVAKSYSVSLGGQTVKTGTYNINGKTGTHTIASGTKTFNRKSTAQTISFGVSFAFNLTWSGVYKGTMSASGSISVPALPTYKVTYDANGGTGTGPTDTIQYGSNYTTRSNMFTRTGYTFTGWKDQNGTNWTNDIGKPWQWSYTYNVTLYAQWKANTYTITYNANGGSGAPSNQTKTYGKNLTLSSVKPTRANYSFLGWATSSSATTAQYSASATFTTNANTTLYAVWKLAYVRPKIYNIQVYKDSNYSAHVEYDFECFYNSSTHTVRCTLENGNNTSTSKTYSTKKGHAILTLSSTFSDDHSYEFTITIKDEYGNSNATITLPSEEHPIDFLDEGGGVAFGKSAELEGVAEFEYDAQFNGPVRGNVLGLNRLPEIPENSDFNNYINTGCWAVYANAKAVTMQNIPVQRAGRLEVYSSTGEGIRPQQYTYLTQRYISFSSADAIWERNIWRQGDNVWKYYDWYRSSLTPAASKYVYDEQKVLWGGNVTSGLHMNETQTINLLEPVSDQRHGIVLIFSYYNGVEDTNYNWQSFFVPKYLIGGTTSGHTFALNRGKFSAVGTKYLYIGDTSISGHADNASTGTSNGITYANNRFVLRYVIGV